MTVQELIAYLKSKRGITAAVEVEESPDGRAYGRFVENGKPWPKDTTFAIRPNGNVFDLAFFKTYKGAVVKTCDAVIHVSLPPTERRAMGYGPASAVPADNGGHAAYAALIEALDARLRRDAAIGKEQVSQSNQLMPTAITALPSETNVPQTVLPQHRPAMGLATYFESEDGQKRALEACRNFLGTMDWAVGDRLKLYDASRHAFNRVVSPGDSLNWFRRIYDDLVRPAPSGGWGIARNASGPLWTADKTFQTLKAEFSGYCWGSPITLLNFRTSSTQSGLLTNLEKMRHFKPVANWPVMAASKVLHFYNPELFPIYDNEVIWHRVLKCFKTEFKRFCSVFSPPYDVDDTPIFYRNYICWGTHLLATAHPRFMEMFADWLAKQTGANLPERRFDASRLFATAYEFTIIGAYADSPAEASSASFR
jgi:hypothetical protein